MFDADATPTDRPPIVVTAKDRDRLRALLRQGADADAAALRLLRRELERADIIPEGASPQALVVIGSRVGFVEDDGWAMRWGMVVFPEEQEQAGDDAISVLTPLGGALLGLGPGQSISWREGGRRRRVTVLEVQQQGAAARPVNPPANPRRRHGRARRVFSRRPLTPAGRETREQPERTVSSPTSMVP